MASNFNNSNSDLKIVSSDGVEFNLHRSLLASHTDAFPGCEIETGGDVVHLSEPAKILRICFEFVYPKRHPDLKDIQDFETIAAISEAVGKYQIFSAMNTCNSRLRDFIPAYPAEIFLYAIKHDYSNLLDETVPYIARMPFTSVLQQISPLYMIPWSRYHDEWEKAFKDTLQQIKSITSSSLPVQCHDAFNYNPLTGYTHICNTCRCALLTWVLNLQEIRSVVALVSAIEAAIHKPVMGVFCCFVPESDQSPFFNLSSSPFRATAFKAQFRCTHLITIANCLHSRIQAIPPFSTFLGPPKPNNIIFNSRK